jgi:O-succinylbenzoic acid--CoA ligase
MSYDDFLEEWRNSSKTVICHSSGSTGKPKSIELPKLRMRESALRTMAFFGLDCNAHLHSCISPDYIGGKMMAVRSEVTGCSLTYEMPSNRPLRNHKNIPIDLLSVVPSQLLYLIESIGNLPEIRNILVGGSPVNEELRERIVQSGLNVWESYGMTETASHIALRCISNSEVGFHTLPGIFVDTDCNSRLIIDMPGWQKLLTNDIAQIMDDGSFVIRGRYDNVIISGSKKVHPEIVEDKISSWLGVPVMLVGVQDIKWGERIVLLIEDSIDAGIISDVELISNCKIKFPKEWVPKQIVHCRLPRTGNGKLDRPAAKSMLHLYNSNPLSLI